MTRRTLLLGTLTLPFAAHAQAADDPVGRAITAMGGKDVLSRVKALNWVAKVRISDGERMLDMTVRSYVEPFVRARTESWLTLDTSTMRSMVLAPDGAFIERNGQASAMTAEVARYQRQQYGLYGYMLLALPGTVLKADNGRLSASRDGLPPIRFTLGADGTLDAADYVVASPDGPGTVNEHIRFDGKLSDKGVNWPERIVTMQDGMPYSTLTFESFGVELA